MAHGATHHSLLSQPVHVMGHLCAKPQLPPPTARGDAVLDTTRHTSLSRPAPRCANGSQRVSRPPGPCLTLRPGASYRYTGTRARGASNSGSWIEASCWHEARDSPGTLVFQGSSQTCVVRSGVADDATDDMGSVCIGTDDSHDDGHDDHANGNGMNGFDPFGVDLSIHPGEDVSPHDFDDCSGGRSTAFERRSQLDGYLSPVHQVLQSNDPVTLMPALTLATDINPFTSPRRHFDFNFDNHVGIQVDVCVDHPCVPSPTRPVADFGNHVDQVDVSCVPSPTRPVAVQAEPRPPSFAGRSGRRPTDHPPT